MTTTTSKPRQTRTALDRAKDDLEAAEKRANKADTRDVVARQEASAARAAKDAAHTEVEAYRELVRKLGGTEPKQPGPVADRPPVDPPKPDHQPRA